MRKDLMEKVIRVRVYDTNNYRYVLKDCGDHAEIQRLPIELLDTTAAIDGWETVEIIK